MGLFNTIKNNVEIMKKDLLPKSKDSKLQKRELKKETFPVMGVQYYQQNLNKLRSVNPEYKKKTYDGYVTVYKYNFINKPVKLIPEPKNKHDKNAVQVVIAGELIGYISREDNVHVKTILNKHEVKYISAFIHGGEYKTVSLNGTTVKNEEEVSVRVTIAYV